MKPCAAIVPLLGRAIEPMEGAFRSGAGVAFGDFALHDMQAAFTRPVFANHLTQHWLPRSPTCRPSSSSGDRVRIAEVGCGEGLAAITIATGLPERGDRRLRPRRRVDRRGRKTAVDAGLADRVQFQVRDAADPAIAGDYDLVLAIEMLHDVPDPVGILRTMKKLAGMRGAVLVADERAEDAFTSPAGEMERFLYAFSTLHCLSVSLQDGGAGTGTVMRADTVRRYATEAGFAAVDVLDVDHPQFRSTGSASTNRRRSPPTAVAGGGRQSKERGWLGSSPLFVDIRQPALCARLLVRGRRA